MTIQIVCRACGALAVTLRACPKCGALDAYVASSRTPPEPPSAAAPALEVAA